jgi:hypothetical protein
LLGIANLLFVFKVPIDRYSMIVMLSISTILWGARSGISKTCSSVQYAFHFYIGISLFCSFTIFGVKQEKHFIIILKFYKSLII